MQLKRQKHRSGTYKQWLAAVYSTQLSELDLPDRSSAHDLAVVEETSITIEQQCSVSIYATRTEPSYLVCAVANAATTNFFQQAVRRLLPN